MRTIAGSVASVKVPTTANLLFAANAATPDVYPARLARKPVSTFSCRELRRYHRRGTCPASVNHLDIGGFLVLRLLDLVDDV
jgi:hypothetical protein